MSNWVDEFCGSPFWDSNLTWYTESPQLTPCFEKTVLVWVPCIFLWIFLSFEIYAICSSSRRNIPWNWRNISKVIILGILIFTTLFDFFYNIKEKWEGVITYPVEIYTPLIKLLSLVICLGLVLCHVRCGQQSSGLLFMFWFLISLLGLPRVYSDLKLYSSDSTNICLISNCISYSLSVIMFFLNFIADLPPKFVDYPPTDNPSPEQGASFPSRITFCWFDSLAQLGFKRPLLHSDLWSMNFEDRASQILPIFDKYWNATLEKSQKMKHSSQDKLSNNIEMGDATKNMKPLKQCSILPALFRAFGPPFLLAGSLKFCQDILAFVSPQLLKYLISYVEGDEPRWRGYLYSALMFAVAGLQTLFLAQYFNKIMLLGLRMRTALISAIYRKALRLSNSARKDSTVGEIVNLMSVDAQRFMDLMTYFNMLWSAPLQISLSLYFLWVTLGPCVLAGLAVMLIMIPFNAVLANKIKKLQIKQMKNKDERIKMMNEILSGIKVLKLYAWEPSFEQQILKIRGKEVSVLRQTSYLNAGTAFLWACSPFLVALVTFATYVLIDENNVLDASKAFVSLSLFNLLRFPLSMLPNLISTLIQAKVSLNRLNGFINKEELDPNAVFHDENEVDSLIIENGVFSWSSSEAAVLKNINVGVKPGSLVAIVGAVGSGKSSLLSAFLGEMEKISGRVNTKGSLAYVPQIAWIQNATLKDNILFGKPLNKRFYNKIVKGSALEQDLEMFPGGDQTEIGEKGINLSGGQKQRVSLARAVYQDADNYFLDDPLSAVDSHVARHIFDNIIGNNGILQKKTRLLVTHGLTYLPEVDMIFVLKDGSISEVGTYNELVQNKGAFSEFLTMYMQEGGNDADVSEVDVDTPEDMTGQRSRQQSISSTKDSSSISLDRQTSVEPKSEDMMRIGEKLIEEEKAQAGSVKWSVFSHYLGAIGLRYCLATLVFSVLYQGFAVSSNFWLSVWSSDRALLVNGTQNTDKRNLYIEVYGLLGLGQFSVVLVLSCCIYLGTLKAAYLLHNLLLSTILQVPVSFFDVTPLGRIINRFGKDVETLDNVLPFSLRGWVNCLFSVLATLFVISYSTPVFMTIVVPIGFIYYFIQRFYVATSRQLKRLESVSRSPIYSHFGESVSGTSTIRAYNAQERFIKESEDKVDFNQICTLPGVVANRWLAVRLEMIGNLIIFFSALFAVINKENLTPGLVGLSVSYALQITQNLNWLVRMTSEVETNIVAVERIKEYADTPQEADWDVTPCPAGGDWPREGQVEFSQFQVRYRPELELVLRGASFVVRGGEKLGIVGRTGAGKSSLTLGLFRILEAAGGHIYIDGVDIALLGLHKLRMALTIIPQDPVLFSGTLRNNLDPFCVYSDPEVWRALELAHLKSFVKGLSAGLHHNINEGGSNLSVGQRQLICLARALLRKTKILILDEATAAVDLETDDLVQRTIRSEFANCTVLTIAHRINTIMDSDSEPLHFPLDHPAVKPASSFALKSFLDFQLTNVLENERGVLVLDKGLVSEFDTPGVLLKNRSSLFYEMVHDAGLI